MVVFVCKVACYHPWTAYQQSDGNVVFVERGPVVRTLTLKCGQCVGCRLERSRQWAVRCMHEAQLNGIENSFVTLTYRDAPVSLQYSDFQLFMKRLRKRFFPRRLRFYMAGEYGEAFGRPHFHACLFGVRFDDRVYLGRSAGGAKLYRSDVLERIWSFGFASVGDLTFESAAYVARYVMKKVTGSLAEGHYVFVDPDSGELVRRVPEFNHMSLKPGIGGVWLDRFFTDVFPAGKVVVNGQESNAPRYYDKRYCARDVDGAALLAHSRDVEGRARFADNSDARLVVKECVARAKVSKLKRVL